MDEAERLCGRIAFVNQGRLISLDTLENLRLLLPAGDLIEIGFERMDDRVLSAISANNLVISANVKEQRLYISAKSGSTVLPVILAIFESYSVPLTTISIRSPSLEDVFIYLTGKNLSDGGGTGSAQSGGGAPGPYEPRRS
jgi:ABC-2 type transport system ATP-binding protein